MARRKDKRSNASQAIAKAILEEYHDFVADARRHLRISFHKVRAHSGNAGNKRADKLAGKAIKNRAA